MSIGLMTSIFQTEFRDLQDEDGNTTKASTAKLVLLAMADCANDEGEGVYPSIETLKKKCALSDQTIRNTFGALLYNGIIFRVGESKYGTHNHSINPSCFPAFKNKRDFPQLIMGVKWVDPSNQLEKGSNGLDLGVNPLDPNHTLTTKETHLLNEKENQQVNDKVEAIIRGSVEAKKMEKAGKSWNHREKFQFNEHILAFADKCAQRFGEPTKKDVSLWVEEIGSWVDAGGRVGDWERAVKIVSGYSQPVISITGMTKAIKFAIQERKNGVQTPREEYHPEHKIVRADPEEDKKYTPMPENLRRRRP